MLKFEVCGKVILLNYIKIGFMILNNDSLNCKKLFMFNYFDF